MTSCGVRACRTDRLMGMATVLGRLYGGARRGTVIVGEHAMRPYHCGDRQA